MKKEEPAIVGKETDCLTIGNTVYKTAGNILFPKDNQSSYFLAESQVLNKMDKVIQAGIIENGMQALFSKLKDL